MSANYAVSSQYKHWQFSKAALASARRRMDEADAAAKWDPLIDRRHLFIYFHAAIQRLGRRMFLRQQALATAEVYLARFYTK